MESWKGKQCALAVLMREDEVRGSKNNRAEEEAVRAKGNDKFNF